MEMTLVLDFYKALADRSRLELVGVLARREASVGELAELLDLREPTVSHHLRRLRELGLVSMTRDGTTHRYRLETRRLDEMSRAILAEGSIDTVMAPEVDAFDSTVLGAFVRGDRLLSIPAKRRKRDVVLRWLAERFRPGERLSEKEVNERIAVSHPDTAWLRRELVGAGLLNRHEGIYWRPS